MSCTPSLYVIRIIGGKTEQILVLCKNGISTDSRKRCYCALFLKYWTKIFYTLYSSLNPKMRFKQKKHFHENAPSLLITVGQYRVRYPTTTDIYLLFVMNSLILYHTMTLYWYYIIIHIYIYAHLCRPKSFRFVNGQFIDSPCDDSLDCPVAT